MILISLELDYVFGLAKILELKIFENYEFVEHKEIIDKIKNWRDEFVAHFNLRMMRNLDNFRQKNSLDPNLVKSLFDKLTGLIEQFNEKKYKLSQNIKEFFEQIEKDSLNECNRWIDNFKKV